MAVRARMPERTGVINAVEPRRSLKDPGCLGMLLIAISGAWRQRGGKDRPLALINGEPARTYLMQMRRKATYCSAPAREHRAPLGDSWGFCLNARSCPSMASLPWLRSMLSHLGETRPR